VYSLIVETTFWYDLKEYTKGQRGLVFLLNGTTTTYTYDPNTFRLSQLQSIRSSDCQILQDNAYTYDPVGNIVVFRDNSDFSPLFTRQPVSGDGHYVYDPLYRLIQATGREHPGQQPSNTDPVRGNVPHQNDLQALLRYTERYEYDACGNITGMSHSATGNNWNRAYQYSTTSNKLLGTSAPGDPAGTYSNTYTYNSHGSMLSMPHISRLNWNYFEQLQSTDLGGGGNVYYCYDSSGNRSRKVYEHSGIIEDRIYLGGYEIYRRTVGTTLSLERQTLHVNDDTKRIVLFETKTIDTEHPTGLPQIRSRWQLDNHLGSSSCELNDNAQVISYEEYHSFGSTSFHSVDSGAEVSAKRYRYTGKERDDETGLYYYGARYYASWLGRWLSADPKRENKDGLNLYTYVKGNPTTLLDPNGMESDEQKPKTFSSPESMRALKAILNEENQTQNTSIEGRIEQIVFPGGVKTDQEKGSVKRLSELVNKANKPLVGERKEISKVADRKNAILKGENALFVVGENDKATGKRPFYELNITSSYNVNKDVISEVADMLNMDKGLIAATMYMEETHGYYDQALPLNKKLPLGEMLPKNSKFSREPSSLLPMNVNVNAWSELGISKELLKENSSANIIVGSILLKEISIRVEGGDYNEKIANTATLYNSLAKDNVTSYGKRVMEMYKGKIWIDNPIERKNLMDGEW
jgi:RHS repeat-associated protein